MKKMMLWCLAMVLCLPATASADDQSDALSAVRSTVDKVLAAVRDKELGQQARRDKAMEAIDAVFDMPLMAKLTLGPTYWPRLNEGQQKEFIGLFVKKLQETYQQKVELVADEKVRFDPPQQAGNKIHVNTRVASRDEQIEIKYKLYKSGGGWKVYDVEIQGVSVVSSYRSQYQQILSQGTVDDLLARMREATTSPEK